MKTGKSYASSGVDYGKIDPIKKLAQSLAKKTSQNSDIKVIEESRGESAFVWEEEGCFRAFVIESLGTKSIIADEVRKLTGKTYYDQIAQDTIAMIVNDLVAVGARPQIINAYFAAGSSEWFADTQRSKDLTAGWAKACRMAGAVWGAGESPSLSGIIYPEAADLAGSAVGIIKPKARLTLGDKIKAGDAILLLESSGFHCNGASMARKIAEELPERYATKLPSGSSFGEEILIPTYIYAKVVNALFEEEIDIHYLANITGHGFRKLMRANRDFTYLITQIPPIPQIFEFLKEHSGMDETQMYGTFNMGAGFAIYLPKDQVTKAETILSKHNLKSWDCGTVEDGPRKVIIKPKNIVFEGETLDLR